MTTAITIMSDAEVQRCRQAWDGDEPGFGALRTEKGNLPLAALDVGARITGLLSEVTLKQTFQNVHAEPLEATYVFPLPDRAAVTSFRMEVNGRVIDGILKERGQARQDYDAAIAKGHRAAIAEEERPGTFTMRVGNLMPGEVAVVSLVMTNPLPFVDGEATFRFPLVVAPRYIPGAPIAGEPVGDGTAPDTDAVPDASRITPPVLLPGFPNPLKLGINVEVDPAGLPLGAVKSSLHAVTVEGASSKGATRRISIHPGERANRDFVLRLEYGADAVESALVVEPDADGKGGTFALTLVPPVDVSKALRPRDVIFVLDRSGSMGGWKMVASRRACARMVDTLNDADRFTVYAFDDAIEAPAAFGGNGLVSATDRNRFRAIEFLSQVDARGGTEMAAPLDLAAKTLADGSSRDAVLVMITDGQVGNEDQILRMLGSRVAGMRIFSVGIDSAVNEGFLKRLAALGGGACELVESEDRLDEAMDRLHTRIGTPVFEGLKLEPAGLKFEKDSIVPTRFPALFAGAPLVITGRYKGKADGGIALQATDSAGGHWTKTLQGRAAKGRAVGQTWARGHLRDLEDRYVITSDAKLEKRILEVSLEFGVLCRFTAFVVVDTTEVVNAGGRNKQVTQPVDAPEGWAMFETERADKKELARTRSALHAPAGAGASANRPVMPAPAPMETEEMDDLLVESEGGLGPAAPPPPKAQAQASTPPAMKMKAPARAKKSSLLGAFGSGGRGRRDEVTSEESLPTIDLASYRARAMAMLDALKKAEGSSEAKKRKALGELAVKLKALVADLQSIGAEASEVQPLAELEAEIAKALAGKKADVDALAAKAETVVRAFAAASAATPSEPAGRRSRLAFWK